MRDEIEAVVGERTAPRPELLYRAAPLLMERASAGELCPLPLDTAPPTDAFILLYSPLSPPCTTSVAKFLVSPLLPGRGEA